MADLNNYAILYRNKQTGFPISNNTKVSGNFIFEAVVTNTASPDGTLESDVTVNFELKYKDVVENTSNQNPYIYNIVSIGDYKLTTTVSSGGNTKTFVFLFSSVESFTTLSTFNPRIVNALTGTEITKDSKILTDTGNKPRLEGDLPIDLEVDTYILLRNGLSILYDPMYDTIKDEGTYDFTVKIRRKQGFPAGDALTKDFNTTFIMQDKELNLAKIDIEILNAFDNVEIPDRRIYINEEVIVDWNLPPKVDVEGTLVFYEEAKQMDDEYLEKLQSVNIGDFERGVTVVNDYGVYIIQLKCTEHGNPNNTLTITRRFMISRKPLSLDQSSIQFLNAKTGLLFDTGARFYSQDNTIIQARYNGFTDNRTQTTTKLIKRDTEDAEKWNDVVFVNGYTELVDTGDYQITFTISEINNDINTATKTISFQLVDKPVDLQSLNVQLKNRLTGENVLNGATFLVPEDNSFPFLPSWDAIKGCNTICTFKISNSIREYRINTPEEFENILKIPVIGEYVFNLKVVDKNYPNDNYITKWFVFNMITKGLVSASDDNYKLYINGIQQPLNKNGFRVDQPGIYNVITVRKNPHNYKYTVNEVNFKLLLDDMTQKPLIMSEPPQDVKAPSIKVTIEFPSYALSKEFSINNGNWISYEGLTAIPDSYIKNGNFIYSRYQDPNNKAVITSERFDIYNIDDDAVNFEPSDLIALQENGIYYSVTPEVKRKYKYKYATILKRGDDSNTLSTINNYKLGDTIRATKGKLEYCQLTITATNIDNNHVGTLVINFKLNGVPPKQIQLGGFLNNQIQNTATPSIINSSDYPMNEYRIEAYMNNRPLLLINTNGSYSIQTPITDPGNYKLSVSVINNANGLREMSVGHFIIDNAETLEGRLPIIPLSLSDITKVTPYDGEFITVSDNGKITGNFGIWRDGILLDKIKDLDVSINTLSESVLDVESDTYMNKSRTESLDSLKKDLYNKIVYLNKETSKVVVSTDVMDDTIKQIVVPSIDDIVNQKPEKSDTLTNLKLNSKVLNNTIKKISTTIPEMNSVIEDLQYTASYIGELKHLYSLYKAGLKNPNAPVTEPVKK